MKANNLNEQIDRILKVSEYQIPQTKRTLVEMSVQQPAQGQPQQQPAQNDAAFERELDTALNQIVQTLPQTLKQIATTQGDRDGQIEPLGQQNQTQPQQQPQQNVAEAELNEAIGTLIAGTAMAVPAVTNLIGKAVSYLGKKADSQTVQNIGHKVSHAAEHLHHKYLELIKGILSPYIGMLPPVTQEKVTNGIFYGLVAALGAAGFAGAANAVQGGNIGLASVEGGLTTVKASELVNLAKDIIPKVLSNVVA